MKRTAFISHSSNDKSTAESICRFLESKGIACWIAPRDVTPGKNYGLAIVDAIDECGVFVLVLSSESNKSGQVLREVERAASANAVIIPVRVEAVQPSRDLEFYVSSSHWLDASQKPLETHLDVLVDAIRKWQSTHEPPQEGAEMPSKFPASAPTRRSNLPIVIGGAVAAIAIIGLAIFLANRSRMAPTSQTPAASTSPSIAQANTPRMGLGRRRAAREQAAAESGAPNSPAPINDISSQSNETGPAGSPPIVERAIASSERPPVTYMGKLINFEAMHAFDGDVKTAWMPAGSGPGESIEVFFKTPTMISTVSIFGGGGADVEHHMANNRVQDIKMSSPNGFSRTFTLEDKMDFQTFKLLKRPVLHSIKFEIISIYNGNKNDVTPIAEIQFNRPE